MKISAIIPAAGKGERFGGKKQLKNLDGHPLLYHTLRPFVRSKLINEIVVVVTEADLKKVQRKLKSSISSKLVKVVAGGDTRQASVHKGLAVADELSDFICVHDAVRPFVSKELIEYTVDACKHHDGVIVAQPSTDTIKRVIDDQILETIPRETVWRAQTPQVFLKSALQEALELAVAENIQGTDEASLLERIGYQIGFVKGSSLNIKITTEEDWFFAQSIYKQLND